MRARNELGHREAQAVVDAVRRELEARSAGAAVAVVDSHGELIALLRTDGCPLPSISNAVHKAFTAAREGVDSGERRREDHAGLVPITNFGDLRYTGWGGGVPIIAGDEVVGAVGVSGLPEAEDIELARLGAVAALG